MSDSAPKHNSLLKVIMTDLAGVGCLALVPLLGPIPGPGGIPLLLTGLGLLAVNHEFARSWLRYAKKHSKSLSDIVFPDVTFVKWAWDIVALLVLGFGLWLSFNSEWWLLEGLSIGIMASSSTIFMLNRDRITKLEEYFKKRFTRTKK